MKITAVETFCLRYDMPYPLTYARGEYAQREALLVKVRTSDDSLFGWGESAMWGGPHGVTAAVIEREIAPLIIGEDPRRPEFLWEKVFQETYYHGRRGILLAALSGVDIALWDIAGQAAGAPVSTLLGGRMRESVRVYASGIPSLPLEAPDEAIQAVVAEARSLAAAGYSGVKMAVGRGVAGDLRTIRSIRDAMGDGFAIYADAAGVYSRADAMRLGRALEELGVGFFEMPIAPEDVEGYAELAQALTIPIALDSIMTRHETVELIRNRAIDIVQPDVCRAGGITECRRIAELADCFGLAFQPHVSIGSAIHVAASAHLAVAMPNSLVCEYWIGRNPIGAAVAHHPAVVRDGYLFPPDAPGLGIGLDADALLAHRAKSAIA